MRTWIPLTLLAAALATTPAAAADPPVTNDDIARHLKAVMEELTALRRDVASLRRDLTDASLRGADNAERLVDVQRRLDGLQALALRTDDAARRAFSFTPPAGPPPASDTTPLPAPPTGSIMLRNFSSVAGTFVLNGRAWTVMPGQSTEVRNVPVGPFSYEISADGFGVIRPMTTRVLTAGSPFYLNINP
jgi:hypothetical protein